MIGNLDPEDVLDEDEVDEIREAMGLDKKEESDSKEPNYNCQNCENLKYIEDHQRTTPSYCRSCQQVQNFERIRNE
jgi:hypothetical protein